MSATVVVRSLDDIANSIRAHWAATEDDRFAIGRDLMEARTQFPGDTEFGQWLKAQQFPFSQQWGYTLRLAAENEPAVRAALTSQLVSGKAQNIEKAVKAVVPPKPKPASKPKPSPKPSVRTKRMAALAGAPMANLGKVEARDQVNLMRRSMQILLPTKTVPTAHQGVIDLIPEVETWLAIWKAVVPKP